MNPISRMLAPALGIVLLATAADAGARSKNVFISAMTPSQELGNPAIGDGSPSCLATFELLDKGQVLRYLIRCYRITGVVAAHIHGPASADTNADPIVTLFSDAGSGDIDGELTHGRILRGTDLPDAEFDSMIDAMRTDMAYVNVHTSINATGEVRGQVTSLALPQQYFIEVF